MVTDGHKVKGSAKDKTDAVFSNIFLFYLHVKNIKNSEAIAFLRIFSESTIFWNFLRDEKVS